jgi:hypothetical protein
MVCSKPKSKDNKNMFTFVNNQKRVFMSKVISCRLPTEIYIEFIRYCERNKLNTNEILTILIDELCSGKLMRNGGTIEKNNEDKNDEEVMVKAFIDHEELYSGDIADFDLERTAKEFSKQELILRLTKSTFPKREPYIHAIVSLPLLREVKIKKSKLRLEA